MQIHPRGHLAKKKKQGTYCNTANLWALYLIFFQAALRQGLVSLFLKGDDDQSDEDVDKEERENYKIDNIEDWHFYPVAWTGTLVFKGGIHGVLQNTAAKKLQEHIHTITAKQAL